MQLIDTMMAASPCRYDEAYGKVEVTINATDKSLAIAVETKNLRIVSVNDDTYDEKLVQLFGSATVNQLVGAGHTIDREAVLEKVRRWNKRFNEWKTPFSGYVVLERATGAFVGQIILKPVKDSEAAPGTDDVNDKQVRPVQNKNRNVKFVKGLTELGFLSFPEHWKKGYGREYTHAIVHHLIAALMKANVGVPALVKDWKVVEMAPIQSIMATCRTDNAGSKKVLGTFMACTGEKPRYGAPRHWFEHRYA